MSRGCQIAILFDVEKDQKDQNKQYDHIIQITPAIPYNARK